MTESPPNKHSALDLGLSSLLAGVQDHGSAPDAPAPLSSSLDQPSSEAQPHPMRELLTQKRWQELISRAEHEMGVQGTPESTLWWVRGHLGALSMPVSLLIAPFEQAVRTLAGQSTLSDTKALLSETGLIMLERLQQVGERDHILAFQKLLSDHHIASVSGELGKHRQTWSLTGVAPSPVDAAPRESLPADPRSGPTRRRARTVILLMAVLCPFVLGIIFLLNSSLVRGPTAVALESFVREDLLREQSFPELQPRDPVGNLSALYYSIDERSTPSAPPEQRAAPPDVKPSLPQRETPPVPKPADNPVAQGQKPAKERVNTTGPLEGDEYKREMERRRAEQATKDGSVAREPQGPFPERQPPTPFDRAPAGNVYRVIARSNVVAAPSYVSTVLGRLEPGDLVLVDGRVGNWFRLRSRRGNDGYVLVQNVERSRDQQTTP